MESDMMSPSGWTGRLAAELRSKLYTDFTKVDVSRSDSDSILEKACQKIVEIIVASI